ncbi:uncharacterized protein LOC132119423 isoform X2 [Carassius carassius]|uniref:uncharacterized protein LOC132119423 isoform X2 n=1 Tax=Carassius carassius TaxID=217509 RepID=UPI002868CEC5|nr:uncharacterized protein LOC132119423 isoform X2 [Carassius carassius]
MSWAKGVLFFTMPVVSLSYSLRMDPEVLSEVGVAYSAISKNPVHFGKLLIGGQGTVPYNNLKTSALRYSMSDGHQSNEEVWLPSVSTKLRHLGSSVQCSNDSMILHIRGPRMPHFLIDRGEESPVPLSEMPASCGFSLKRARRDVSLVAPYRGCHVRQQGARYILPLIIMGNPVQVSCPVNPPLPTVSCFSSGMIVKFCVRADDVKVKVDGSWQPLLLKYTQCSFMLDTTAGLVVTAPFTGSCWEITDNERRLPLMYGDREVTLACPLTQPTITPSSAPTTPLRDPTDMQQMFGHFPLGGPWRYPPYPGVPATLPPTVPPTAAPFRYPFQQPMYPPKYPMPIFDPFYPKGDPATPPAAQPPQYPWYPKLPPYMTGFHSPVEVTTPATTTTAPYQPEHQYPGYPMYPPFYGQLPNKSGFPTVKNPFMPPYPKASGFGARKLRSSPALSSVYGSPR